MPLSAQLEEREDFETRTLWALVGAAVLAPVAALASRLSLPVNPAAVALLGAAVASARGDWKARLALGVGLMVAFALPLQLPLSPVLEASALGLLAAGAVDARELGRRPFRVLAGALGAGALAPLGLYVKAVMDARLFGAPLGMASLTVGLPVMALFWSVGRLAAHVRVHGDAVVARGAALKARLTGEVQGLVGRAALLHQECRREVARLAPGAGRTRLGQVLDTLVTAVFALAEEYAELAGRLAGARAADVGTQVKELRSKAAATTDAVARRQLELAASSLGEELNHLDALDLKRERLLAQLHAQVALVERARVSLVGVRGGDAAAKGAQAEHLAQRLAELGREEDAGTHPPVSPPTSTRVGS